MSKYKVLRKQDVANIQKEMEEELGRIKNSVCKEGVQNRSKENVMKLVIQKRFKHIFDTVIGQLEEEILEAGFLKTDIAADFIQVAEEVCNRNNYELGLKVKYFLNEP